MSTPTFNEGDRVRYVGTHTPDFVGHTGVVVDTDPDGDGSMTKVLFDEPRPDSYTVYTVYTANLELVSKTTTTEEPWI